MKYTDKEKEYLNKIFKYTRKINKTPIKEIISKTGISTSTYYQLEKGHISKDEIYDKLIDAFNLKYMPFDWAISYFEDKIITIQKLVEYLDIDNLSNELDEIENKFNKYNKYIFYQEIVLITQGIRNHFVLNNRAINRDMWDKLYNIYILDDSPMKYVLLEILGSISRNYLGDDSFEIIKSEILKYSPTYIFPLKALYMMNDSYFESLTTLVKTNCLLENNPKRLFKSLIITYNRMYDIDYKNSLKYKAKIIELIESDIGNKKEIESAIYALMIKHLISKEYIELIELYEKYKIKGTSIDRMYIIALDQLEKPVPINMLNDILNNKTYHQYIFEYIKLKQQNTDYKELEFYLLNFVILSLKQSKGILPYWPIFFDELEKIVAKTRNYKSLLTFKKEMDKMKT